MTDKKLSQLPAGTTVHATDLIYSAQDAGGGTFTSAYQPMSALVSATNTSEIQIPSYGDVTSGNDITAILQNIITNTSYGIVTIGPGTWKLDLVNITRSIWIRGAGRGATIIQPNTVTGTSTISTGALYTIFSIQADNVQ